MPATANSNAHNAQRPTYPAILEFSRFIGRKTPALRGKNFVIRDCLARLNHKLPTDATVTSLDGLSFAHCDINQYIYRELCVYGVWEPDVVWIYNHILQPGDTVIDIGACFGFHALRAAKLVGDGGRVIAFEPQPDIHANLLENVRINQFTNIEADCCAFNATGESVALHRFSDRDVGTTSISKMNHEEFETIHCLAFTLDGFIADRDLTRIDLIKLDVEGAELGVLQGATQLLSSARPPMWVLEINEETAHNCGYHPRDLLKLLTTKGYVFYRPAWGNIVRRVKGLERCDEGRHGDNLLCIRPDVHGDRLREAGIR